MVPVKHMGSRWTWSSEVRTRDTDLGIRIKAWPGAAFKQNEMAQVECVKGEEKDSSL